MPLKNQYTDWLSKKMRPLYTNAKIYSGPYLSTDYIKSHRSKLSSLSIKNFILFLKFLRFTKDLNYDLQELDTILYRVIIFKVKDLTTFCESMFNSDDDSYKVRQVKKFLEQLQSSIFVEIFNDSDFMQLLPIEHQSIVNSDRLAGIHRVTLFIPPQSKGLLARVVLMEDLFHYQYPFQFPDLFDSKLSKYDNLVRVEFIRTFSSKDVEKCFHLREFFNIYKISNQKTKDIKQTFIDMIQMFQRYELIEDKVLLIATQNPININKLTTSNISNGVILYEKFNPNFSL